MFYPWIPTKPLIWRLATNTHASLRPACRPGSVARAVPATREARRGRPALAKAPRRSPSAPTASPPKPTGDTAGRGPAATHACRGPRRSPAAPRVTTCDEAGRGTAAAHTGDPVPAPTPGNRRPRGRRDRRAAPQGPRQPGLRPGGVVENRAAAVTAPRLRGGGPGQSPPRKGGRRRRRLTFDVPRQGPPGGGEGDAVAAGRAVELHHPGGRGVEQRPPHRAGRQHGQRVLPSPVQPRRRRRQQQQQRGQQRQRPAAARRRHVGTPAARSEGRGGAAP